MDESVVLIVHAHPLNLAHLGPSKLSQWSVSPSLCAVLLFQTVLCLKMSGTAVDGCLGVRMYSVDQARSFHLFYRPPQNSPRPTPPSSLPTMALRSQCVLSLESVDSYASANTRFGLAHYSQRKSSR